MGTWNLKQSGKLICLAKPKHYLIMDHVLANFNFLEEVTINIPINGVYIYMIMDLFVYPTVRM